MIKEIKKEDIPDWQYGDVAIKTYSFGEQMTIAGISGKIKEVITNGKKEFEPAMKDDINLGDISIYSLAAGIHYVRTLNGEAFIIEPNSSAESKKKQVFNFEKNSGNYLLGEIREVNKGVTEEEKKDYSSR